ncbi:hypothetical protein D3C80_2096520 [compost metagenome]
MNTALNLILLAVSFRLIADIGHWQIQLLSDPCRMRYACRRSSRNDLRVRIIFTNNSSKALSNQITDGRISHG